MKSNDRPSRRSRAQRRLTPVGTCASLQACRLLTDDYEQVRSAAVQMVWVLSQLYPERQALKWFYRAFLLYLLMILLFCHH